MKYWLLIILTSIIFPSLAMAAQRTDGNATVKRGVAGAQFLKIGLGPRAMALGGAYCSIADDAAAVYWNPAGLTQVNGYELAMMQNNWLPGIGSGFISFVYSPEEKVAYACSVNRMDVDKMPETRIDIKGDYEETGNTFGAQDTMLIASYAKSPSKGISLGSNLKFIQQMIADEKSFAVATDLGMLYQMGFLRLGVVVQNIGTGLKFVEERARLPIGYRFGASIEGNIKGKKTLGIIETATWLEEASFMSFGVESHSNPWLTCRAGYRHERDTNDRLYLHKNSILKGFSCGFGLSPSPNYQVDYAFVPQGDLGFTHMVSLQMRFVPKPVKEEGVKEEIPSEVEKIEKVLPAEKAGKPEVRKPAEKEEVKKPEVEKSVAREEVIKKPEVEKPAVKKEVIKKPEAAVTKEVKKLHEPKYMVVTLSDNITLWSGPGVTYQAITTLNKGIRLRVIDDSKTWYYHVQLENGTMGWVSYVFVGKE